MEISNAEALGACKSCGKAAIQEGCIVADIEACREEMIVAPVCMLPFLSSTSDQRPPKVKVESSTNSKKDSTFSTKKSGKSGSTVIKTIIKNEPDLSRTAQRFLAHIKNGIISVDSLMHIEKCKKSNVYKYLSELCLKGYIDRQNKIVEFTGGTNPERGGEGIHRQRTTDRKPGQQHVEGGAGPYMRAHSPQFRIQILHSDDRYLPHIGDKYYDDGNRILLWEKVVEIYAGKDKCWDAATVDEAVEKSLDYFQRVIARIQNQNKIILLKNRSQNIKIVKHHIGRVNDELAKDVIQKGDKFHVYAEDGKLRLLVDNSHEHPELEAVHPSSAKPDMNICEKHYKDWLEKDPPKSSELASAVDKVALAVEKSAQLFSMYIETQRLKENQSQAPEKNAGKFERQSKEWDPNYG